jgi:hypothetical protein
LPVRTAIFARSAAINSSRLAASFDHFAASASAGKVQLTQSD